MNNKGFNWFFPIVIIAMIMVFFGNNFIEQKSNSTINEEGFFALMKQNKVKEVVIYTDTKDADVYLTPEAKTTSVHSNKTNTQTLLPGLGQGLAKADYDFKLGDIKYFQEKFDNFKSINPEIKTQLQIDKKGSELQSILIQALMWFGVMFVLYFIFFRKMFAAGGGGGMFSIGKSRAKVFDEKEKIQITFQDVAGLEGAKEEVQEVVDFLKNASKICFLSWSSGKST